MHALTANQLLNIFFQFRFFSNLYLKIMVVSNTFFQHLFNVNVKAKANVQNNLNDRYYKYPFDACLINKTKIKGLLKRKLYSKSIFRTN